MASQASEQVEATRRERHDKLIQLIESWVAEDSDPEGTEADWLRLKERIEESRTSYRKRFAPEENTNAPES